MKQIRARMVHHKKSSPSTRGINQRRILLTTTKQVRETSEWKKNYEDLIEALQAKQISIATHARHQWTNLQFKDGDF